MSIICTQLRKLFRSSRADRVPSVYFAYFLWGWSKHARGILDNAIIVWRLIEDDTGTPRLQVRASKFWIHGGCLSWYDLTRRQSPMIAVKEYNGAVCNSCAILEISIGDATFLVWPSFTTIGRRNFHQGVLVLCATAHNIKKTLQLLIIINLRRCKFYLFSLYPLISCAINGII